MKLEQAVWCPTDTWESEPSGTMRDSAQLVMVFGSLDALKTGTALAALNKAYPSAEIIGCSTAGEILGDQVKEGSVVSTAICFDSARFKGTLVEVEKAGTSYRAGERLAECLEKRNLVHVLVLSDGLRVNGSELIKGMLRHLPRHVTITGGLSADDGHFRETAQIWKGALIQESVLAIGLYGNSLKVGCGSLGGFDPFGPERLVTRSEDNILYELDGKSALALYKEYLGQHAAGLPGTAFYFPLAVRTDERKTPLIRTVLGIDEEKNCLRFAGDMPLGAYARLMKSNSDRIINGAISAAKNSLTSIGATPPNLAILISCVGRKLILKQRTEDEVEGVHEIFGSETLQTGFYSYGELAPTNVNERCELHNQTMSVTTLTEE